jgi:hypothetical protein
MPWNLREKIKVATTHANRSGYIDNDGDVDLIVLKSDAEYVYWNAIK